MEFISMTCPSCSKSVKVPAKLETASCMYCGARINVPKFTHDPNTWYANQKANDYLELGSASLASDRNDEAYKYFSAALEVDTKNADAWIGKAKASIGMATLADLRSSEIILCVTKFIDNTEGTKNSAMEASKTLSNYASMIAKAIDDQFSKNGGTLVGPMGSMVPAPIESECRDWVNGTMIAIGAHVKSIEIAENGDKSTLIDAYKSTLNTIETFILKSYLAYIDCTVHFTDGRSHTLKHYVPVAIDDDTRKTIFDIYEMIRGKLNNVDQEIGKLFLPLQEIVEKQNRETAKREASMCFIATACYGSAVAAPVITLRQYRDLILAQSNAGRFFIKTYYKYGPYGAEFIRNRPILREFVKRCFVLPTSKYAAMLLKMNLKK